MARPLSQRLPKAFIGALALVPLVRLGWRFYRNALGANPIAEALNQLGLWALIILLASLACTPIKIVTGWNWPLRLRRLLGLEAFFYACLHFTMYIAVDQSFDFGEIWKDIIKRQFMTIGFAAFVLLVPLAVTSTNKMVKRLGFPRWKALHRLAYLAASLAVVHFIWRVKSDKREPLIYTFVLGVLLAVRVIDWLRHSRGGAGVASRAGARRS
jgi:sulfoxide reductase heme-binding subunit YedZ